MRRAMTRLIHLLAVLIVWALPVQAQSVSSGKSEPATVITNTSVLSQTRRNIWIDFPQSGSADVSMELSGGCGSALGLCVSGQGYIEFAMWGDARVELRVRPDDRQMINKRRLGVFEYATDPGADVPEIYYDVRIEVIDASLGPDGFSQPNVIAPGSLTLWDYTQNRHDWRIRSNLRRGPKIGRIYIQPLFESTSADIFAAPGTYTASIALSIFER